MSFDAICGQPRAVDFLRRMVAGGRVPSALLFLGPQHVGKRSTALALAKALNCRQAPGEGCHTCPSCRKIDAGAHPDVDTIEPDGQFVRIGQVRALCDRLDLVPVEARKRVMIVAEAERFNLEAANAFLKTLEEPPADTLIVLCAERAAQLPETIVSRCLRLGFGPLPHEALLALLAAESDPAHPPEFALRFAQGRLRPELAEGARGLSELRDELLAALQALLAGAYEPVSAAIARWTAAEQWRAVLELLETWCHDLVMLGQGAATGSLIHGDRLEELRAAQARIPPDAAQAMQRRVLETREHLLLNVNKALAFDALWLGMQHDAAQPWRR